MGGDMTGESLSARLRSLARLDRVGQFVSVGVAGASLETVIVFILTGILAVSALPAKAVGAEASISLMFLLNDNWTFANEGGSGLLAAGRRYLRSHLVRLGGLTVAFATLFVLTSWTDVQLVIADLNLWPTIANGVGIGVGMVLNYVAESLFTWRVDRD